MLWCIMRKHKLVYAVNEQKKDLYSFPVKCVIAVFI